MYIFKRFFNRNKNYISKKRCSKTVSSDNNITDFILKVIFPNFTIFSGAFLFGLPFFKLGILRKFRISPLLLSFSRFEILVFLISLSIFLILYFFALFSYDIKNCIKNSSFMNNLPLISFIVILFIGLYIFFFNYFSWICLFFIIIFIFSLKYKRSYKDFLKITNILNILPIVLALGMFIALFFVNNYLERFMPFSIIERSNNNSKIINLVIAYHNDKPIIKQYNTTKKSKNYFDNFLPGYEYDGVKYSDVVYGSWIKNLKKEKIDLN